MNERIRREIAAHAEAEFPREACGLLIRLGDTLRYIACRNMSEDNDQFILDPRDYAACERAGVIEAVVHSHPNSGPEPSQADRVACEASGLQWHIYSMPEKEWGFCQPHGYEAPLYGRVWVHGVLDCYSFIRDWYKAQRGIELPDFDRREQWWKKGENIYVENFEKAGFRRITKGGPQPGDVLLMQILSDVPNHGAIYLEGDIIAHHLYNRLSTEEIWGGYYRKHTTHILRHESNKT